MIIKKFLTPKGWRVVSHSMLAAAAIGIIYLFSMMIITDLQQGEAVNWWVAGTVFAVLLFTTMLGSMLAKAELTDWR